MSACTYLAPGASGGSSRLRMDVQAQAWDKSPKVHAQSAGQHTLGVSPALGLYGITRFEVTANIRGTRTGDPDLTHVGNPDPPRYFAATVNVGRVAATSSGPYEHRTEACRRRPAALLSFHDELIAPVF